jgi:hypothetical protein
MERGWPSLPPRRSSCSPGGLLPWLLGGVGLGVGARRPIHDLWLRTAMPRVTTPTARPVLVLTGQPRTTAGPPRDHQNDNGDQCGDDYGDDDGHAYPSDARRPDSAVHVSRAPRTRPPPAPSGLPTTGRRSYRPAGSGLDSLRTRVSRQSRRNEPRSANTALATTAYAMSSVEQRRPGALARRLSAVRRVVSKSSASATYAAS